MTMPELQSIDALMLRLADEEKPDELEVLESALLQRITEVKAFSWYLRRLENQNRSHL